MQSYYSLLLLLSARTPLRPLVVKTSLLSFFIIGLLSLVGCVNTEPLYTAPHLNLSPETVQLVKPHPQGSMDVGLAVTSNESDSLDDLEVLPGLRVRNVASGSQAERGGIRAGDIILSVNDVATNDADTLATVLASAQTQFRFELRRDTVVYSLALEMPSDAARIEPVEQYRVDPIKTRAGYKTVLLEDGQQQRTGLQVVKLFPQSPLALADIQVGDFIIAVDGEPVSSAQSFIDALTLRYDYGDDIALEVMSQTASAAQHSGIEMQVTQKSLSLWQPPRRVSGVQLWPLFVYRSTLAPDYTRWALLDFWLFSLLAYEREMGEKTWSLFSIFTFSSDFGELSEVSDELNSAD